ncbi:MAG: hypothetical protein ACYTAF_04000 [Planctomycetota bacterium]|jgi:DNA-binding PadR family transcriptional regulator
MKRLTAILLLCLLSCGGEAEEPPQPPELQPVPDIAIPDVPEDSFLKLDSPAEPPSLRWKLPRGSSHRYSFAQQTYYSLIDFLEDDRVVRQQTDQNDTGHVTMEAPEKGKARVRFAITPEGAQTLDKEKSQTYDYAVLEDGTAYAITEETARAGRQYDLFLSLPGRPMAVGETVTREIRTRGDLYSLAQKGTVKTTLTGYVQVRGLPCARLESVFEADMTPARGSAVVGGGVSKGRFVSYFAYEEGVLVQIDAVLRSAVRASIINADLDSTLHIRKK